MNSVSIRTVCNAASASALALLLYGVNATQDVVADTSKNITIPKYDLKGTESSNEGTFTLLESDSHVDFEERITNFYTFLTENQVDIGYELEGALLANLSDLYED